jgi:hypothetical protein
MFSPIQQWHDTYFICRYVYSHDTVFSWCQDKTSGDKTSEDIPARDISSGGTKRPGGYNLRWNKPSERQNVRGDETSGEKTF